MKRDIFKHLSPVPRLAARILEKLDWWGGQMTKRELERKLSAHKELLWKQAWEHLISTGSIEVKAWGAAVSRSSPANKSPKTSKPVPSKSDRSARDQTGLDPNGSKRVCPSFASATAMLDPLSIRKIRTGRKESRYCANWRRTGSLRGSDPMLDLSEYVDMPRIMGQIEIFAVFHECRQRGRKRGTRIFLVFKRRSCPSV